MDRFLFELIRYPENKLDVFLLFKILDAIPQKPNTRKDKLRKLQPSLPLSWSFLLLQLKCVASFEPDNGVEVLI